MPINYVIGDATEPVGDGPKLIVHCCNDMGKWGKGFVMAISKKWPEPERDYRNNWKNLSGGNVQYVPVSRNPSIVVANIIGQNGIYPKNGIPPIRYDWIALGLKDIAFCCDHSESKVSIHMPRIGCGLAGGKWSKVEQIIKEELLERGIEVYVYDLTS